MFTRNEQRVPLDQLAAAVQALITDPTVRNPDPGTRTPNNHG
jgi:hypothetical protein